MNTYIILTMLMVVIKLLYLYFLDCLEAATYHSPLPKLPVGFGESEKGMD